MSLIQRMVEIFLEETVSSGEKNITKEQDGKCDTTTVCLLLVLFDASVFLVLNFSAAVQECTFLWKIPRRLERKVSRSNRMVNMTQQWFGCCCFCFMFLF